MAVIGSYNGASIIAFPERPGIKQIEFVMNDTVAMSRSPFTGSTQVQAWPGSDWLEANITLPQMVAADAQVWTAFLAELRGITNVFYLSDPLHRRPAGNPQGSPVISGVNAPMAHTQSGQLLHRDCESRVLGHSIPLPRWTTGILQCRFKRSLRSQRHPVRRLC